MEIMTFTNVVKEKGGKEILTILKKFKLLQLYEKMIDNEVIVDFHKSIWTFKNFTATDPLNVLKKRNNDEKKNDDE